MQTVAVPEFSRWADFAGVWAIEPRAGEALARWARETDLAAHVAAAAPARPRFRGERVQVEGGQVAVIEVVGVLMKSVPSMTAGTSTVALRRQLSEAAADPDVTGILLRIDSPGGTVAGTADLADAVRAAAARKPLVAHVEDLGASAAYWVAAQAAAVYANTSTALVGSIGALMVVHDFSAVAEQQGIKTFVFATGPLKGAGVEGSEITDEQADYLQGLVDGAQVAFDAAVRTGRGLSAKQLDAVKSGGVFGAAEAERLRLIDGIQSLDKTLSMLASGSVDPRRVSLPSRSTMPDELETIGVELNAAATEAPAVVAAPTLPPNSAELVAALSRHPDALSAALAEGWTTDRARLHALKADRPTFAVTAGHTRPPAREAEHLQAALAVRAGAESFAEKKYGERVLEQSRPLHYMSLVDLCRVSAEMDGLDVSLNPNELIRAGMTSGGSLATALGGLADGMMLDAYMQAPATWRQFCGVRSVDNFRQHTSIRPTWTGGNLRQLPRGGSIDHTVVGEETYTHQASTFARQFAVDRQDFINDDLRIFSDVIPSFGRTAARSLNDLVYFTLLNNSGSHFSAGNSNLLTSSALNSANLGTAIRTLREMTDADGNYLDLAPGVLAVPTDLEQTALELLNSAEIERDVSSNDRLPTGNSWRSAAALVVEPRLSNGVTHEGATASGSTTDWYLFAGAQFSAVVVSFLRGRQMPTVESFGLSHDPDHLSLRWRVYHDYGCDLSDTRTGILSQA